MAHEGGSLGGQTDVPGRGSLLNVAPPRLEELAARAPIVAITYSSIEFAGWDRACPWPPALQAVVAAGAVPLAIDCAMPQPRIDSLIALTSGLIVLGGGDIAPQTYGGDQDDPTVKGTNLARDENEIAAFASARTRGLPTLAICRGYQLLNLAGGGELIVDIPRDRPSTVEHQPGMARLATTQHPVEVEPGSRLAKWLGSSGSLLVNSQHHQGVASPGENLRVVARSDDGLIEAVEAEDGPIVGVQWHPEFLWRHDAPARKLLRGFVHECFASSPHTNS